MEKLNNLIYKMGIIINNRYLILVGSFLASSLLFAQDPHLSQYNVSKVLLNPAHTGVFNDGSERTVVNFRSQWASIGSKITTTAMAYDLALDEKWGFGGFLLYNDGAGTFNTVNFSLSGARDISKEGQDEHQMSVGLQLGFIYKSTGALLFDNQYNEKLGFFNGNTTNGENITQFSRWMPEISFGYHYQYVDKSRKLNPYGGLSIFHVTSPKEFFLESAEPAHLPRRWVLYGGTNIYEQEGLYFTPNFLYMRQGKASQLLLGVDVHAEINEGFDISGGVSYRLKDAIIPMFGIHYKKFEYRLSYDINVSGLNQFSNGKGAIELSVVLLNK